MDFRKIQGPFRVDGPATGGSATSNALPFRSGGRSCKQTLHSVKVVAASSNCKPSIAVEHGPDGTVFGLHSTALVSTAVPGALPGLMDGQSDTNKVLNEFIRPVISVISSDGNPCWAVIELFEMRKPF